MKLIYIEMKILFLPDVEAIFPWIKHRFFLSSRTTEIHLK